MTRIILFFLLFLPFFSRAQNASEEALALQFFQGGEYEKALPIYQKLYEKSGNLIYYDPYFTSLLRLKKHDEAERLLKKLISRFPENLIFKVDYGRILQERGEAEKVREWFGSLIKALPPNEFEIRDLATTFYRAEAYDYAVKTLIAGRGLLRNESAFSFELISLYRYQKNKEMLAQEFVKELAKKSELLSQAKSIISSVFENDQDYQSLERMLLTKIQKEPEVIVYRDFLIWISLQQKQFGQALKQALALDKRLKENGERLYELASTFVSNKAYPEAIQALNYLTAKGQENAYYIPAKIQLLNIQYQVLLSQSNEGSNLKQLEKDYEGLLSAFGQSAKTASLIRQLAGLKAFYLNKPEEAISLMEKLLELPGIPPAVIGQAKLELGDIYILTGEVWEAALLYGQVTKQFTGESIGQEANFRSAKLSYYQGDFDWAKAQLDVLKSATSQLIANDALDLSLIIAKNTTNPIDSTALKKYAAADLLVFKKRFEEALLALESINKEFPGNNLADDILMTSARIYIQQGNYLQAAEQLKTILEQYSFGLWADDALFMLAELNETQLKNTTAAQELYQKLITDHPGSLHLNEARKRFRNLRGG